MLHSFHFSERKGWCVKGFCFHCTHFDLWPIKAASVLLIVLQSFHFSERKVWCVKGFYFHCTHFDLWPIKAASILLRTSWDLDFNDFPYTQRQQIKGHHHEADCEPEILTELSWPQHKYFFKLLTAEILLLCSHCQSVCNLYMMNYRHKSSLSVCM